MDDWTFLDFVPFDDRYEFEAIGERSRSDQTRDTPAQDYRLLELIHRLADWSHSTP